MKSVIGVTFILYKSFISKPSGGGETLSVKIYLANQFAPNEPNAQPPPPIIAAAKALKLFQEQSISNIVELGAGLGRDTLYFAKNSIHVEALDYSKTSIEIITDNITVDINGNRCDRLRVLIKL